MLSDSNASQVMRTASPLLLVEDNELLARSLKRALTQADFDVTVVHNLGDALRLFQLATPDSASPYALGVFDIDLPDGDGTELAEQLLASGVVRDAVFYSGCADARRLQRARGIGEVVKKGNDLVGFLTVLRDQKPQEPVSTRIASSAT